MWCFYDAAGVAREAEDHLRVWTKCLRQTDIEAVNIEKDHGGEIARRATEKQNRGYVPPLATLEKTDAATLTAYEEMANIGHIEPKTRVFQEINCRDRTRRLLSIDLEVRGKMFRKDTPGNWVAVPPESNAGRLLKLVCSKG